MRHLIASFLVLSALPAGTACADASGFEPRVRDAIVASMRQRVGADADVIVDSLEIFIPAATAADARIDAVPDPAAHLGGGIRFVLTLDGVRSGRADAQLHVRAERAHAVRFVARGATLAARDVEDLREEIADGPLRAWPRAASLAGARTLRDLNAGSVVTAQAVFVPPAVRTGQTVTAVAHVSGIEAAATMVAAESGNPGSVIRVVNRATRKTLRARIVSSEVVEIIHD